MSLLLYSVADFFNDTVWYAIEQVWSTRENPAWLTFELTVLIGGLGLAALLLYPFARD